MKQPTKMITPNNLEQAKAEIKAYDLGKYELTEKIQESEAGQYLCVGLTSSDGVDGLSKNVSAREVWYNYRAWDNMAAEIKKPKPLYKKMGGGVFNKLIVIHNPTLSLAVEKEETPKLTEEQKQAVQQLKLEGMTLRPIAQKLNIKEKDLKPYFETLK